MSLANEKRPTARSVRDRKTASILQALALLMLSWLSGDARSQVVSTPEEEVSQAIKAPRAVAVIGEDLFGDKVNLYTGRLEFVQVDVSLRGNRSLPVSIGRRIVAGAPTYRGRAFGAWDLDIPHMHGVFYAGDGWVNDIRRTNRCTNFSTPTAFVDQTSWSGHEFWQGNFLYVPGVGDQQMLSRAYGNNKAPGPLEQFPVVTKDFWSIGCIPALANDTTAGKTMGEGFLAISPEGIRYRFDHMVSYDVPGATKARGAALKTKPVPDGIEEEFDLPL